MDKVSAIASRLHDLWREPRRTKNGVNEFEPRWKDTTDQNWITIKGTNRVDIANTAFADLPQDWQKENLASAIIAQILVSTAIHDKLPLDKRFVESASAVIHEEWVTRNYIYAPPEQRCNYKLLSEEEKEKDRSVINAAIEILSK